MKEVQFTTQSGVIAGIQWGASSKPLVLALHGWLDNAASFSQLAPMLSEEYCIVAIDLPGHGHSDFIGEGGSYYVWESMSAIMDVLEYFEHHGEYSKPVAVLGHSMGGVMASLYAGSFPDQINTLILLDSMGPMVTSAEQTPQQLAKGIMEHRKSPSQIRVFPNLDSAIKARQKSSQGMTEEELTAIVERNLMAVTNGFQWRTDQRLRRASKVRFTEEQVSAFLSSINSPVLAIVAASGILPKVWVEDRSKKIADVSVKTLAGHHHFHCNKDSAVDIAAVISSFLKG